ncbi:hypothetical protein KCP71_24185 [Salmonella enterica subsp. enterica]|nr:hypothetical protein KCP71_24185 [Salmonella enterica subsp. enterica]
MPHEPPWWAIFTPATGELRKMVRMASPTAPTARRINILPARPGKIAAKSHRAGLGLKANETYNAHKSLYACATINYIDRLCAVYPIPVSPSRSSLKTRRRPAVGTIMRQTSITSCALINNTPFARRKTRWLQRR